MEKDINEYKPNNKKPKDYLNRREFLRKTGLATTGIVLLTTKTAGAEQLKPKKSESSEPNLAKSKWDFIDQSIHMTSVAMCEGCGPFYRSSNQY